MNDQSQISSPEVLRKRFTALWSRCAGPDGEPQAVWKELEGHYGEAHRHYHVLAHLAHCLRWLDRCAANLHEPDTVEMALWFHDIIYRTEFKDNEARSARLFRERGDGLFPPGFTDRVCEFIMATVHDGRPGDSEAAYVVDIDLSSLGLPWNEFQRDSANIRKEFGLVPDNDYYGANHGFLSGLLRRERVYYTEYFHQRLERTARENIGRYLHKLEQEGLLHQP